MFTDTMKLDYKYEYFAFIDVISGILEYTILVEEQKVLLSCSPFHNISKFIFGEAVSIHRLASMFFK